MPESSRSVAFVNSYGINTPTMANFRLLMWCILSQKDPLEKGMPTHSNIFAWRIPWTEKPAGLQSMGSQRVGRD